ncbi:RNA-binding protein hfq [filamentous cyanobacterium CCP5]|nr:RNA-binding protein hfq [filamentous cyanobacterium CCP5]
MGQEFEPGLPSARQIQTLIRSQQSVEVKLMTGDVLQGQIRWQDPNCIKLQAEGSDIQVWNHAIAYVKVQS